MTLNAWSGLPDPSSNMTTNTDKLAEHLALTDDERTELLDWVSACQSQYHIDSTPGHRFGGLGSNLEENRLAVVDFVNGLLSARALEAIPAGRVQQAEPVAWILTNGKITSNHGEVLAHDYQGNESTPLYLAAPTAQEASKPVQPEAPSAHGWHHWDGRIKALMEQVGLPNSLSLRQAFSQLVNEMSVAATSKGSQYARTAAELRHQHSRIDADEALMRQALDAVKQLVDEKADYMIRNKLGNPYAEHTTKQGTAAITALRKRLESSK